MQRFRLQYNRMYVRYKDIMQIPDSRSEGEEEGSVSVERVRHHTFDVTSVGMYCIVVCFLVPTHVCPPRSFACDACIK